MVELALNNIVHDDAAVGLGDDGEANARQQPGVDMNRNNNNNDDRNQPHVAENIDINPPIDPLGDWQNVLPGSLVDHPVISAFIESRSSFLVSDPHLPGNPIVFASPGFLQLTGYPVQRVLGRNCRFLQGPGTDPVAVSRMRDAIDSSDDVSVRLLNYRYDGTTFLNQVLISGIRNDAGEVLYYLGLQCVVSNHDAEGQENEQAEVSDSENSSQ